MPSEERCAMTQVSRGKPPPICKQMTDCPTCPGVLVTLRRNQSFCSTAALCDIPPRKGPLEAVGFGVGTLSVARRNLPRIPGEYGLRPHPVHLVHPILMSFPIFAKPVLKRPPGMDTPQRPQTTHSSESLIITGRKECLTCCI